MADERHEALGAWATADADPALRLVKYWADLPIHGRQLRVETTWSFAGPRMEPIAVTVTSIDHPPRPVVGDAIRAIPFGALNREARDSAAAMESSPIQRALVAMHPAMEAAFGPLLSPPARPGPQRGYELSEEDLEEVAAVYRAAWERGLNVREAVVEHFHISASTAAKRIKKAKDKGMLDDLKRGAS